MNIPELLRNAGLKCTAQRRIVAEALLHLRNHPTAEAIITYIHQSHPEVAQGTIYHILGIFQVKGLVKRVMTDDFPVRYEFTEEKHHHLHFTDTGEITDYFDPGLDRLLTDYFAKNRIADFKIEEIEVQIKGKRNGLVSNEKKKRK